MPAFDPERLRQRKEQRAAEKFPRPPQPPPPPPTRPVFDPANLARRRAAAAAVPKAPQAPSASFGDIVAGLPITRFAMGVAAPVLAAGQAGANLGDAFVRATGGQPVVGKALNQALADYEAAKQRGMAATGRRGYDWMGLLGNLVPSAALTKAVTAALPSATSALGRAGLGSALGGTIGAATPVTTADEGYGTAKAAQVGMGAALGGLIPLTLDAVIGGVTGATKLVGSLVEPLTAKGRAAILQRYQHELLGKNPETVGEVTRTLQGAKELVPGSQPTAAEALSHLPKTTGLATHQQDIARKEGISPLFAARAAMQERARQRLLGGIAKTPAQLQAAMGARAAEAEEKYGLAGQDMVTADRTLLTLLSRPSMRKILRRAHDLMKEQGQPFAVYVPSPAQPTASGLVDRLGQPLPTTVSAQDAVFPVSSLHAMKMAMDDLIKNPERFGIGATEARAIANTQREFVHWLDTKSPAYHEARQAFQQASVPINRMQVGQQLQKALESSLRTAERGSTFATAMREAPRTITKATGNPRFTELGEVFRPPQVRAIEAIRADLARKEAAKRLAGQTNLGGLPTERAYGESGSPLPNLLSRPAMLTNYVLRKLGQGADEQIAQLAAKQYLTPAELAAALPTVPPSQRAQAWAALLEQVRGPVTITAPATAAARAY